MKAVASASKAKICGIKAISGGNKHGISWRHQWHRSSGRKSIGRNGEAAAMKVIGAQWQQGIGNINK